MSIERYASSIFCDDVRREVGNKISYMGVYQGTMYLDSFPAVLPRFCISIQAVTPMDKPFDFLKFKVLSDGNVIAEQDVPSDMLKNTANITLEETETTDGEQVFIAGAVIQLQPFSIEKHTKLSVRVDNETEELKALSLNIVLADSSKNS